MGDGGAGFAVDVGGLVTAALPGGRLTVVYDTFAVTTLPGNSLTLRARYLGGEVEAQATGGTLVPTGPASWTWTAPAEPGVSHVLVTAASGQAMRLQAITLVPFDHSADAIGDYAIGDYQDEPMNGDPVYDEPAGFVEVTPDLVDLPVSPHFRLGQFLAKQEAEPGRAEWPKYVALSAPLLVKLERLAAAVRAAGRPADGLTVMSGFRTPAYNAGHRQHDRLQPPPVRRRGRRLRGTTTATDSWTTSTATAPSRAPTPSGSRRWWTGSRASRGTTRWSAGWASTTPTQRTARSSTSTCAASACGGSDPGPGCPSPA